MDQVIFLREHPVVRQHAELLQLILNLIENFETNTVSLDFCNAVKVLLEGPKHFRDYQVLNEFLVTDTIIDSYDVGYNCEFTEPTEIHELTLLLEDPFFNKETESFFHGYVRKCILSEHKTLGEDHEDSK